MAYSQHPDKYNWEYRLLAKVFESEGTGIHQGIFAVTPSGKLIRNLRYGWPAPDPVRTLQGLRQSLAEYQSQSKFERLLARTPNSATDKLRFESESFARPVGVLDLRVVKRSYPFSGMTAMDVRSPEYYSIDRLWYKPTEYRALVPNRIAVGESVSVSSPFAHRLVTLCHLMVDCSPWRPNEIQKASLTSRIEKVEGDIVTLALTAEYALSANSQYNKGRYGGTSLGNAKWDRSKSTIVGFELVSYGKHFVGEMKPNMHVGSAETMVGSLITLNPVGSDPDNQMIPTHWKNGYPRGWGQRD